MYGVNNKIDDFKVNQFVTDEYRYDISESECQYVLIVNEKAVKCKNNFDVVMSDPHGFEKYYCCNCYNNEKIEYEKDKNYYRIYFHEKKLTKNILKEKIRQKILNKNIKQTISKKDESLNNKENYCELLLDEVINKKMLQSINNNVDYNDPFSDYNNPFSDYNDPFPENIKEFYTILDIPLTLNLYTIKRAYYILSLLYHPDKNTIDTKLQFQNINEAYKGIVKWVELKNLNN